MIVLEDGHAGAAFHSMIKLAYAIETENDDEIIRALAYFASEYLPLPVTEHSVAISDMEDAFSKVMSDVYYHNFKPIPGLITTRLLSVIEDQHFVTLHFKLEGDVESQYKAMASYAVKEFLRTGDFLELHTITALHAMDVLKPYFNDFTKVMQTYVTAYIGSLLTIKTRDNGVMTHITRVKEWDDALYYIKQTMDVHTIKFLYTCRELDKKYCLDTLMTAVNIRFGQDKMINR